jgi:Cu(I)/Ag(I) efflux system membrane protein CusA/SilA
MISSIVSNVIRFRVIVLILVLAGILVSFYTIRIAPLDAIPDISDPQIVIYAKWPRSPQLLEAQVTEPLINALAGSSDIQSIRSTSHMGYSFIYVILSNGAQRARVQQLVLDRVNTIRPQLPSDATVTLGPNASSIGWIYQYAIVDHETAHDMRELRLMNESQIKPALQSVPGVAEVASVGGLEKQYQLKIFPPLLANAGIPIKQVVTAVQDVFQEAGGRMIEVTNRDYQLRGAIDNGDIDKLEYLVLGRNKEGNPVYLRDIGYIQIGYDQRRSTVDLDGNGEVVGGVVIMEQDQNVLAITRSLDRKLKEISASLPKGVEIITTYDRSSWIWATLKEFFATLISELVIVSLVTILFLRRLRAAAGPIVILLLSVLFTVLPMAGFNQTINLFSLAGLCIAIGAIDDATIVIVENCTAELSRHKRLSLAEKKALIVRSITAVAQPLLFSLLIILASFVPVFFLEEREARLFDPLAFTKTFAMAFSTLLTLLLLPIVISWIFRRHTDGVNSEVSPSRWLDVLQKNLRHYRYAFTALTALLLTLSIILIRRVAGDFREQIEQLAVVASIGVVVWIFQRQRGHSTDFGESRAVAWYRSALRLMIKHRYAFTGAGFVAVIAAAFLLSGIGKDFLPETDEGSILYMPSTLPGLPNREAGWVLQQMDKKLKQFPEVDRVFGKIGRADTSTDPAPLTMIETTVLLRPKSKWRSGMTKDKLVAEMDNALQTVGYVNTWVQPIRARVMMQSTGIQTPVGIKVKGPEITQVEEISQQIEAMLRNFPGTKSVIAERISEGYYVDVQNDLERMAQHGVTVDEAMMTVRYAIGGDNVVGIKEANNVVTPLNVQYSPEYTDTLEKVKTTPVVTADGRAVPLSDIATVSVRKMPEMLRNDDGHLSGYVYVDLQKVTPADYVEKAREFLSKNLSLPAGYSIEWTGVYKYTEDARARMRLIVPVTLVIIFGLLVLAFRSVSESILTMMSVPFAMVGGVFLQWALGYPMTTAVIIGYISLFAVAVQTGVLMVAFIREALHRRTGDQSFVDAVVEGSVNRLRPKLMTVATIVLSLSLIPFSTGPGMEIMKPIAAPSIGGMVSSTIHVLFMTPCLFVIVEDFRLWRSRRSLKKTFAL